jgi:hypothetical protein
MEGLFGVELNMVEIKQVSLWRAEGRHEECYPIIFVNDKIEDNHFEYRGRWDRDWNAEVERWQLVGRVSDDIRQDVLEHMADWGKTAPKGAYDKTDFLVHFTNGFSYAGRFDMSYGGLDGGEHFFKSVRSRMKFYIDNERPAWIPCSVEEWDENIKAMRETLAEWNWDGHPDDKN